MPASPAAFITLKCNPANAPRICTPADTAITPSLARYFNALSNRFPTMMPINFRSVVQTGSSGSALIWMLASGGNGSHSSCSKASTSTAARCGAASLSSNSPLSEQRLRMSRMVSIARYPRARIGADGLRLPIARWAVAKALVSSWVSMVMNWSCSMRCLPSRAAPCSASKSAESVLRRSFKLSKARKRSALNNKAALMRP